MNTLPCESDDPIQISFKMATQRDFTTPWYLNAMETIDIYEDGLEEGWQSWDHHWLHRKLWEWAYLVHVVTTMDLCKPGKRGLVTAVGQEMIPQLFASMGCDITATDLPNDATAATPWAGSGQHSASAANLYSPGYKGISKEDFMKRVKFQPENINSLSPGSMHCAFHNGVECMLSAFVLHRADARKV